MTEESRLQLLNETELIIKEDTKALDSIRHHLTFINELFTQKKLILEKDETWVNFENLLRYRLFINILNLDLSVAVRLYLKSTYQYEGVYAARQIIVIINEGYKKIYNFIQSNSENEFAKNRNNSFWIKNIGRIIKEDLPVLKTEYERITKELDNCLSINFSILKTQRDLSVHYDEQPEKVYDMLVDLNIDEILNKLIPFLKIIQDMKIFTNQMVFKYNKTYDSARENHENIIDATINKLRKFENDNNRLQISELIENVKSLENIINNYKKSPNT